MLAGQVAFALLMATARLTVPVKPLRAVTVIVVLPLEFRLTGIVFGARLMAKSGVVAGGTMFSVMVLVWLIAPLVPVITSGYLPSVAPAGTLMVSVAVVGVAMLGVTVADGVKLAVAPLMPLSPETLRVMADWKVPSGSILAVTLPELPLGISTFIGVV